MKVYKFVDQIESTEKKYNYITCQTNMDCTYQENQTRIPATPNQGLSSIYNCAQLYTQLFDGSSEGTKVTQGLFGIRLFY